MISLWPSSQYQVNHPCSYSARHHINYQCTVCVHDNRCNVRMKLVHIFLFTFLILCFSCDFHQFFVSVFFRANSYVSSTIAREYWLLPKRNMVADCHYHSTNWAKYTELIQPVVKETTQSHFELLAAHHLSLANFWTSPSISQFQAIQLATCWDNRPAIRKAILWLTIGAICLTEPVTSHPIS